MTITKATLIALRADLDAAIKLVGEKYDVTLRVGNGSFTDATATFKLEVAANVAGLEGESPTTLKARADWPKYAEVFDLNVAWLDKSVDYNGTKATIIGLMPNRTKFPVLMRAKGRKDFLLTAPLVSHLMAIAAKGK